jgi:hypothetical protein
MKGEQIVRLSSVAARGHINKTQPLSPRMEATRSLRMGERGGESLPLRARTTAPMWHFSRPTIRRSRICVFTQPRSEAEMVIAFHCGEPPAGDLASCVAATARASSLSEAEDWEEPNFTTCANTANMARAFETSRQRSFL